MISISELGNMNITLDLKIGDTKSLEKISISDVFQVDRTNINEELSNQAALYAYFAVLASDAEAEAQEAKFDKEVLEAQKYAEYREACEKSKDGTKITEALLKNLVINDEDVKKAELRLINSDKTASILTKLERAMAQRKDMVFSIASNARMELEQMKADAVKSVQKA